MWSMLKKLGAGEYSLKITFWLFGLMGMFFFTILTHISHSSALRLFCPYGRGCSQSVVLFILSNAPTLMTSSGKISSLVPHLLMSACFVCYFFILIKGLWKCSENYEGAKFWTFCAKLLLVCLGVLSLKSII